MIRLTKFPISFIFTALGITVNAFNQNLWNTSIHRALGGTEIVTVVFDIPLSYHIKKLHVIAPEEFRNYDV